MPHLQKLHERHADSEIAVLNVNENELVSEIRKKMGERGYTFSVIKSGGDFSTAFNVTKLPTTVVLRRDGHVVAKTVGADASAVDDTIRRAAED